MAANFQLNSDLESSSNIGQAEFFFPEPLTEKYRPLNRAGVWGAHGGCMNGYIAFWRGKRVEVHADSSYAAQLAAAKLFKNGAGKNPSHYDVDVVLAEKDGQQVTHVADF
jgi:hypothetical protein